jgi:hypothetical protein
MPAGDTAAGCGISTADVSYVKTESRDGPLSRNFAQWLLPCRHKRHCR